MMIGLDDPVGATGAFHARISRVAAGFDGPVAVLIARGEHLRRPLDSEFRILTPVTGTEASRRAAEVAVAVARASGRRIAALHVAGSRSAASSPTRLQQEAILKDVVALAERYGTDVRTAVRIETTPEDAILREVRRGRHDLIVMGVNRRPGEVLFFGNVAQAVLNATEASVLFVAG